MSLFLHGHGAGEVCEAAAAAVGPKWSNTEGIGAAYQLLRAGARQYCLCHGVISGHQAGTLLVPCAALISIRVEPCSSVAQFGPLLQCDTVVKAEDLSAGETSCGGLHQECSPHLPHQDAHDQA